MTLVNELVGQRALLKVSVKQPFRTEEGVSEYRIEEISPSGNWVKLLSMYGSKFWRPVTSVSLVEVLKDLRREPPPAG